jgi:lysyl-tRNA synthetase class II
MSDHATPPNEPSLSELKKVRLEKLQELQESGIDPFGTRFERDATAQKIIDEFATREGRTVRLAGRIMSKRRHGKAGFADLQDLTGSILKGLFQCNNAAFDESLFVFGVFIFGVLGYISKSYGLFDSIGHFFPSH